MRLRLALTCPALLALLCTARLAAADNPQPFGSEFPNLDSLATGEWWAKPAATAAAAKAEPKKKQGQPQPPPMDVPRDQVVAFALYTAEAGVLKLTAQLFPLKPGEPREARLEFFRGGQWVEALRTPVLYPGWSAHFRVEKWDGSADVRYRVRHGASATFEGLVRRDPRDKAEIVVASLSCNSSRTTGRAPRSSSTCARRIPTCSSSPATRPTATPSTPPAGSSLASSSAT